MSSTPNPDQYLEKNLRDFLKSLGDETWDIAEDYFTIEDQKLSIDEKEITKKIATKDIIKKGNLNKTFALFFLLYSAYLKKVFDKNQDILIKRKMVKTLGKLPIALDNMKPDKRGSSPYVKKWADKMEKASLDFQKKIPEKIKKIKIKNIRSKELNVLIREVSQGRKTKKQLSAYLKKKVLFEPKLADRWAQDLTGTYYAESTKKLYNDGDIDQYIWVDVGDDKVRAKHRALNGTIRSINDGVFPGEEKGCRCIATPYFDEKQKKTVK